MGGVPAEPFPRARSKPPSLATPRPGLRHVRAPLSEARVPAPKCRRARPGGWRHAGRFRGRPALRTRAGRLDIPRRPRRAVRSPRRAAPASPAEVRARARSARAPSASMASFRWPARSLRSAKSSSSRAAIAKPLGPVVASQQQPRVLVVRGIATDLLAAGDRVVVHPLARERLRRLPKVVDGRLQVPLSRYASPRPFSAEPG